MKAMLFRCLLAALLAFGTTVPAFATKDRFSDYDSSASGNEDVGGVNIQGTAPASNMDDSVREIMSHIADHFASDTIASGTTTDLGAKSAHALTVTGTTTITGFGTVKAGTIKFLTFSGALTLTHNGTSLIIPGAANITTAAGDTAIVQSLGSGNWRVLEYLHATNKPAIITPWTAYTPTFTGFGTPSNVAFFSRRVGDTLQIRGKFTAGTVTATEGRITMGFNGTNNNVTSDATKVPSIQICGLGTYDTATGSAWIPVILIESNVGYLTFGAQSTSNGGLTKQNGNIIVGTGWVFSFTAEIPISGW